jgi:hypothetical protein
MQIEQKQTGKRWELPQRTIDRSALLQQCRADTTWPQLIPLDYPEPVIAAWLTGKKAEKLSSRHRLEALEVRNSMVSRRPAPRRYVRWCSGLPHLQVNK